LFGSRWAGLVGGTTSHGTLGAVLVLGKNLLDQVVCHCLDGYPLEACGLLAGSLEAGGTARITGLYPTENAAASARIYEVDPRGMLRADRDAEAQGVQIVGVYHSHTHTDAKPSPTDIDQAPDPDWRYVLVSLRDLHPSVRSWQIQDGKITEEPVVLE
jgi:[CysO sulfur-carrier protein]-S-L-cysteine hydrolase